MSTDTPGSHQDWMGAPSQDWMVDTYKYRVRRMHSVDEGEEFVSKVHAYGAAAIMSYGMTDHTYELSAGYSERNQETIAVFFNGQRIYGNE